MDDWPENEDTALFKQPMKTAVDDDWDENELTKTVETNNNDDWADNERAPKRTNYSKGDSNERGGYRGAKEGGGGGGGRQPREGDWECAGCQNQNFAFRKECQRCKQPKAGEDGDGKSSGDRGGGGGGRQPREGDWECAGCQNKNFAFRKECQRCKQPKADEGGENGDGEKSEKPREIYVPPEPTENEAEMYGQEISAGINFDKFDNIEVKITEDNIKPVTTFEEANLRAFLLENVKKCGYIKPTPVQKYAIPIIASGRDVMGCAQTGSGKTAAFILPILNKIMSDHTSAPSSKPICLIMAPTRELAIQIHDETRKFSRGSWLKVALAYGGTASNHQATKIEEGAHVLVCTPGRLMDFLDKKRVSFDELKFLVLDEADRLLDMGFKENIKKVCEHPTMNKANVQTLMFSATFPERIQALAATYLRDYVFFTIGIVGGASTDVEQEVLEVGKKEKRKTLSKILGEYVNSSEEDRILVFVETKKTADFLASFMSETKISSTSIHGDRLQRERETALREFRQGIRKVLIATSVAARGLDIKGVTHVINYDLPNNAQDYVHRIGRTGRVGNRGKATSFYDSDKDNTIAPALARILTDANQPVPEFLGEPCAAEEVNNFGGQDIRQSNENPQGVEAGETQETEDIWN